MDVPYDALLVVSFGGPEAPEDVMPFLENVLRGKPVPRERMLEVAEHYYEFGGVSPINEQCRSLIRALVQELNTHGPQLPVYWGNRNWHPMLTDTLEQMKEDGIQRALAFFTSAYSSYSGCRQYRENIIDAQQQIGEGAPIVEKLRVFFNHPGFIEPITQEVKAKLAEVPDERRAEACLVFTAHSIPSAMSQNCEYENQLREACRLVAEHAGHSRWQLVYQSRSGSPSVPWLEPDICDHIKHLHESEGVKDIIISPIGFVSDHMEVLFDLDTEAREVCDELGINMLRAATVGAHPRFITMIRELIQERISEAEKLALGELGPCHDVCPVDCCLSGRPAGRPAGRPSETQR